MFREVGQSLSILGEFQSPRGEGPEQTARTPQGQTKELRGLFHPIFFFSLLSDHQLFVSG